jgi:predicted nucleotidyltransferase component of viral defense system
MTTISIEEIRRRILIAMFSDDELMNTLVLKGGNALALVHKIGNRASFDMDFSMQTAFSDTNDAKERIFKVLRREFESVGYTVFDEEFSIKPSHPRANQPKWWGGYLVEFKLIERTLFEELRHDLGALRRQSEVLGPLQKRKYGIDISKYEFCEGKVHREVDDYTVYVYSLEMIAVEKLRAICQQMPQYVLARTPTARARDFYDVYQIVKGQGVDLTTKENLTLLGAIFAAKEVPLDLLGEMQKHRDFHVLDWPSVEASISGPRGTFDDYFDFVVQLASTLQTLGIK